MKKIVFLIVLVLSQFSCNKISKEKAINKLDNNTIAIKKETVKNADYSIVDEKSDTLSEIFKSFIPINYSVLSIEYGDLNLDKFEDAILVLHKNNEELTSNMRDEGKPEKRPLLLLLGQRNGSYKIASKNNNAILCFDCIGIYDFEDAFSKVTINNGNFNIENEIIGSRHWAQTIIFKFNKTKNNWFLYKTKYVNYKPIDGKSKKAVVNYKSIRTAKDFGEIPIEKFNINDEDENTITPHNVHINTTINTNLISFISKNHSVLSITYGDLNLDEFGDAIIVLSKDNEEGTSHGDIDQPEKRTLLLLLGQKSGSYKLAYKNDNIIPCIDYQGAFFEDIFTGITIKNGYLYIGLGAAGGHQHWERTITFTYNKTKKSWFLYKLHSTNYRLNDGDNDKYDGALIANYDDFKTAKDFGIIPLQKFNFYNNRGY
ncbi:hypothetical protein CLU81_0503 [Flavobacterium sp. 9]|uniref:hypothetical protein n=1 Tax=Flavobacterium sp. 9 TaxID=2035198 RepID=UPI000C1946DF|nr:hypothetical protein [Flavobacterium sp. 9]PIF30102.1 hypothetical protein CLU81_0503 [Flavobacterium sp. 9]